MLEELIELTKDLKNYDESYLIDLLKFMFKNVKISNKMDKHDIIVNGKMIELKCRKKHYDNLMLERKKYEYLKDYSNSYYMCSTPLGIYLFKISELNPIWEKLSCPITTDFSNNNYITKEVYNVEIKERNNITKLFLEKLKSNLYEK